MGNNVTRTFGASFASDNPPPPPPADGANNNNANDNAPPPLGAQNLPPHADGPADNADGVPGVQPADVAPGGQVEPPPAQAEAVLPDVNNNDAAADIVPPPPPAVNNNDAAADIVPPPPPAEDVAMAQDDAPEDAAAEADEDAAAADAQNAAAAAAQVHNHNALAQERAQQRAARAAYRERALESIPGIYRADHARHRDRERHNSHIRRARAALVAAARVRHADISLRGLQMAQRLLPTAAQLEPIPINGNDQTGGLLPAGFEPRGLLAPTAARISTCGWDDHIQSAREPTWNNNTSTTRKAVAVAMAVQGATDTHLRQIPESSYRRLHYDHVTATPYFDDRPAAAVRGVNYIKLHPIQHVNICHLLAYRNPNTSPLHQQHNSTLSTFPILVETCLRARTDDTANHVTTISVIDPATNICWACTNGTEAVTGYNLTDEILQTARTFCANLTTDPSTADRAYSLVSRKLGSKLTHRNTSDTTNHNIVAMQAHTLHFHTDRPRSNRRTNRELFLPSDNDDYSADDSSVASPRLL